MMKTTSATSSTYIYKLKRMTSKTTKNWMVILWKKNYPNTMSKEGSLYITCFFNFSEENLFQTIRALFVAGTDTTTGTLRWILLHLLHNPEVQKKCQQEITQVFWKFLNIWLNSKHWWWCWLKSICTYIPLLTFRALDGNEFLNTEKEISCLTQWQQFWNLWEWRVLVCDIFVKVLSTGLSFI